MAIDIATTVGRLTADETAEMAKTCLCELNDAQAIETIVEFVSGDLELRDQLVADLEKNDA